MLPPTEGPGKFTFTTVPGGFPITVKGDVIGAVAAGGARIEQDVMVAQAALAAIGVAGPDDGCNTAQVIAALPRADDPPMLGDQIVDVDGELHRTEAA